MVINPPKMKLEIMKTCDRNENLVPLETVFLNLRDSLFCKI